MIVIVYHPDYSDSGRVYWAECDQMPGWSAAADDLMTLMNTVPEAVATFFPGKEVDVRHRWHSDPMGRNPVVAVRHDKYR
jgi:hypothetical protein